MTPQEADFAARVARIEVAAGKRKATLYVGTDETYVLDRPEKHGPATGLRAALHNAGYPLSMVLSFLLGCLALCICRYVRFQFSGVADIPLSPDMEMLVELLASVAIAVIVSQLDGMKGYEQIVAKAMGIVMAMLTFHNLVHLYPVEFERLFSPLWVSKVLASTKPHSIVWRGISFIF